MLYQYRRGSSVIPTTANTGTTMSAMTNRYSRKACLARSSLPVAAHVASGMMATKPQITSTVKRSFM